MKDKIAYYDKNEKCNEIDVTLKFLTPHLRSKIIKHDTESQLAFKKFQKEIKLKDDHKLLEENAEKIIAFVEDLKARKPGLSDEELENEKNVFIMGMLSELSPKEIKDNHEKLQKTWTHNDEWAIKFFKLIVDMDKLDKKERELIETGPDSDFWQNTDIEKVVEINRSFRTKYQI